MARPAKAFLHEGNWTTNAGGLPRTTLRSGDLPQSYAQSCLNRWLVKVLDVRESGKLPAGVSVSTL